MNACVYILECGDGSLYTGWTNDIQKRLAAHRAGSGSRYTRSRLPVALRYVEPCGDRRRAMARECEIKALSRADSCG
jgi:Predicted endonuclease containing a URI domain